MIFPTTFHSELALSPSAGKTAERQSEHEGASAHPRDGVAFVHGMM
jgi:hypothetical protein